MAILLGENGTVATDAMGPFSVFSSSGSFDVRTVSASRAPVALSGGLATIPDATFEDYGSGLLPRPDIVVVPAITDPAGDGESALRGFIDATHDAGAHIMGVCAGARVLVETDVLRGRNATSFWSDIDGMISAHPETSWIRGQRWVEDGDVLTTAGVSSGIAASLHVVAERAGVDEALRIAAEVRYPHWAPDMTTSIPVNSIALSDYPYVLNAIFPWGQPRYGLGLVEGVDEIDVAAAAELYGGAAFTARVVPVADGSEIETRHGMTLLATPIAEVEGLDRVVIPGATGPTSLESAVPDAPVFLPAAQARSGNGSFDAVLADIARTDGRHVAEVAAKYIEYPVADLPRESGWPTRVVLLGVGAVLVSVAAGLVPLGFLRRKKRV
ncbi:DJ-1/PfpI family protein [Microbacterium testaceum]|uniref:DJ-1/PfpI family protein n=1 Tax=Microbacterium testaceum TaxID=2033 RepID=UPI0034393121